MKDAAKRAARRAGLFATAGLLLIVGAGFLTAALWFALSATLPATSVALIIGGGYVGIALILLALASLPAASHPQAHAQHRADPAAVPGPATAPPPAPTSPEAAVVQSFLVGLDAGRKARGRPV